MKKQLTYLTLLLIGLFFKSAASQAQTLTAGDIAFVGFNTDDPDGFSFIALKNLPAGETLYFTEEGWGNAVWSNEFEPHLQWVIPSGITIGTIVSVVETSPNIFTVTGSSNDVTLLNPTGLAVNFNLSAGDQILAYQSFGGVRPNTPIFISGVHGDYNSSKYDATTTWNTYDMTNGGSESLLPPGLTNGLNAISLFPAPGPEIDNAKFTGSLTGTASVVRARINNPGNWSFEDGFSYTITPSSYTPANITADCTNPTITMQPSNSNICAGNNASFSVSTTGANGYKWQVNAGSGFVDITNGGIYSNATTTALTITGATAGMNGYQYRAVAMNGTCSTNSNSATITVSNITVASAQAENVSCFGGSNGAAGVSASGGIAPYSYSWSPSGGASSVAVGLSAGNYTVTITDNIGCQTTKSFLITQPASAVSGTTVATNVSCNGGSNGSINLTPTGGTGPYTFNWGGGVTTEDRIGLTAGSYSVTITDINGCSGIVNTTITQSTAITASISSQTNVYCNGGSNGSATVTASGGAGGYTYSWAPYGGTAATATGLTAGTYTVTVRDANFCEGTVEVIITEPSVLQLNQSSMTTIACNGGANGSASVSATGGAGGYTYDWSPGTPTGEGTPTIYGLSAGAYYCTVTDSNGCIATSSTFYVTQPSVLTASATVESEVTSSISNDGGVSVLGTGGTPVYTYLWNNGATTATVTGLAPGTYTCTITDANGCEAVTSVTLNAPAVAPTAFDVTGGGGVCSSNTNVAIGLSGSELGVNYQLKLDDSNVGDVIAGTGQAISFGTFSTSGTYTVQAINANDALSTLMTGEALISTVNYVVTIGQPLVPCVPGMPAFLSGAVESVPSLTIVESVEGFTADYAPSNWIFTNTNADGNVDTSDAPASLSIISGNNNSQNSGTTDYSITIPATGTLSFNWNYSTSDGPGYDYPQLIYNNVVTTFTDFNISGSSTQSGTVTLEVTEGATLVLRMYTADNVAGAATVVISNFQAPQLTPVEANLLWTASNGGTIVGATDELETEVSTSGTYTLTASLGDCSFSQSVVVDFENPVLINTTWNGTAWSNGVPSFGNKAIIDGDLVVAEQLITCELEITANGSLTVQPNAAVGIVGKITNNATAADFVVENNGVLTQLYDNQNIGPVTVNVTSYPLYRQDYTLWSSPVENHNLRIFSPQTIYNRFSSYDNTIGTVGDYVQEIFTMEDVANKTFATGKGYLIRSPNNWPEYVNNTIPGVPYEGVFKGVPENGSITIPLSTANGGLNLVGNPYPSPIDIEMFFNINPDIEETIYYWRKRNGATGSGYATYNSMGFVSSQAELAATGTALESMPLISVGQGFFVKSTGATALNFSNEMRGFMGNGVFLKSTPVEKHRFWLNLSNSTNTIGQALIGYTTGATQGVDSGYDSSYFNDSPVALTSLINGGEYSIQGLGLPFDATSSVALGFKTNAAGAYTISLNNFDGMFAENQDIYIKDNVTGLVHNLKESAYSFTATEGIANERFEIVYQPMLETDNPTMELNKVMVYKQEKDIYINASSIVIQKVELYDIRGSLIQVLEDVNQTTATFHNLNIANQVVLVKITSVENKVITKKIVY